MATTTLSFAIDTDVLSEIVEQVCFENQYDQRKLAGETKAQFSKRMYANELRQKARVYRVRTAMAAAAAGISEVEEADVQ